MKRSRFSLVAIVSVALLGVLCSLVFSWRPLLGLDLQGGASVVLEPSRKVSDEALDRTIEVIRNRVDSLGVAEPEISRQGNAIVIQLPGIKDQERALAIVGQTAQLRFRPVLGDLGSENEAAAQAATAANSASVVTSSTKVGNVSNSSTTAPAKATTSTVVTTPSTTTTSAAPASEELVAAGGGARLATGVLFQATADTSAGTTTKAPSVTTTKLSSTTNTSKPAAGAATTVPVVTQPPIDIPGDISKSTPIEENDATKTVILPRRVRSASAPRLLLGPAELGGTVVKDASISSSGLETAVVVEFNDRGAAQWDAMASKYYQQRIAIELDGVVLSDPQINAKNFGGRAEITGGFTRQEARDLATALRFGALPVQLKPQTVQTVSATLGRDSLWAGLLSGGLGILLVAAYMIFFYRKLGLVVVAGLAVSGALMWTIVAVLGETQGLALSLSGAVGLIISVGITVDSYVVYFERMRDELRGGKPMASSVDRAFRGAWRTILAADLTSILGALTLYLLTVGSVRGFAFFLAVSTGLDLIVSYYFTRPLVAWLTTRGTFGGPSVAASTAILKPSAASAGGAR